jgi:hypothetical protein
MAPLGDAGERGNDAGAGAETDASGRRPDRAAPRRPGIDASVPGADGGAVPTESGETAAYCTTGSDCAGADPYACATLGIGDPPAPPHLVGGYCASSCDPDANDPVTGLSPDCPGTGSCGRPNYRSWDGRIADARCFRPCTARDGERPCPAHLQCYLGVCQAPGSEHGFETDACDPTVPLDCGDPLTCLRAGLDDVGVCHWGCDVFAQDCNGAWFDGCVASAFGQGHCTNVGDVGEGAGCSGPPALWFPCGAGLTCRQEGASAFCRAYCGGPLDRACPAGQRCVDLSSFSPKTVVGVCSPS